jgi:hypothetical protein
LSSDYTNEQSFYVSENDVITKKNDFNGVVNWEYDYYNDFRTFVNNAITTVENFFDKNEEDDKGMVALTAVGQPYSGYNSICSLYRDRSNAVIKVIEEYLAQVHTLCENDVNTLKSYKNKDSYIPYNTENSEAELLKDANKYCIYWYHYNPGFTLQYDSSLDNEGNKEYLYGNFAGANWKRITHIPIKYNSQEAFNADTRAKYLPSIDDNDEVTYAPTTSWIENTRYYIECVNVGLPSEKQNKRDENNNIIKDENGNPIWYYAA